MLSGEETPVCIAHHRNCKSFSRQKEHRPRCNKIAVILDHPSLVGVVIYVTIRRDMQLVSDRTTQRLQTAYFPVSMSTVTTKKYMGFAFNFL